MTLESIETPDSQSAGETTAERIESSSEAGEYPEMSDDETDEESEPVSLRVRKRL